MEKRRIRLSKEITLLASVFLTLPKISDKFIHLINLHPLMAQLIHYPNLKTVLQVEKVLQQADTVISKNELQRRLPTQIMHQTLSLIL